jgi:hypothetical protein
MSGRSLILPMSVSMDGFAGRPTGRSTAVDP